MPVRLALAVAEPIAEFAKKQLEKQEDTEYEIIQNTEKRMMA